ncbi:MAG TPA: EAL domain-containing protein [Candidatus Omnitrophota bacterium]|nr:EAL domain-containing protein [Candidatus Omnitrophota bacterium]
METKKLILIIDDERDFAEMMRFALENAKFRVVLAALPQEGIEKAGLLNPDLVLLDLNMPGMSGHEVCKTLKENLHTTHIPIIMLTCQDKILDKIEAFNLGVADYIGKHFPFEEILVRIKAILQRTANITGSLTMQERNEKIQQLRTIIEQKSIRTLFQPIVIMKNKEPFGYEALARGPQGTFLENPVNLFALAEEAGMSFQLDSLCLSLAVERAAGFVKKALLFLNTDPAVINSDYVKNLEFLSGSAIPASQICLEITERTFISNFTRLASNLNDLKPMGVMIVIDDLGEGYASLKSIAELKPQFIKVDMSLIRNVHLDIVKQSLIQVICDLSRKINSRLIAEGVETQEEYACLLTLGVEFAQGYFFGRPSPTW